MSHWNTSHIVELLSSIANVEAIETTPQGGDVDTTNLVIKVKDSEDNLYVCGFTTEGEITSPDDTDIEMIEVTDGKSSDGGLNSDNRNTFLVYADVVLLLRREGHTVVRYLKDYF